VGAFFTKESNSHVQAYLSSFRFFPHCGHAAKRLGMQQQDQAALGGSVVNSVTGQALKNVHLALRPEDGAAAAERSAVTSTNGAFRFTNVAASRYLLVAE
jgi:hypothetical protein